MPRSLLKDGRTVDNGTVVDFDATHTNSVNALTTAERAMFVAQALPDPPVPIDSGPIVLATYAAGLRRQSLRLKKRGNVQGSVDLLLKASGVTT